MFNWPNWLKYLVTSVPAVVVGPFIVLSGWCERHPFGASTVIAGLTFALLVSILF